MSCNNDIIVINIIYLINLLLHFINFECIFVIEGIAVEVLHGLVHLTEGEEH